MFEYNSPKFKEFVLIDVTEVKPLPFQLYFQYRNSDALKEFFRIIHSYIEQNYFKVMESWLYELNFRNENLSSDYNRYFLEKMLGIYKPLGSSALSVYYDGDSKYDEAGLIYDNSTVYNGTLKDELFKAFASYITDFQNPLVTIMGLQNFIAEWCGTKPSEVLWKSNPKEIVIFIPAGYNGNELHKVLRAYYNELGLPFGTTIDFRSSDRVDDETPKPPGFSLEKV